jgi:hypothetical protein
MLIVLAGLIACQKQTDEFSDLARFDLKVTVPYLNADSTSRLRVSYELVNKAGQPMGVLSDLIQLDVNGHHVPNSGGELSFSTTQTGPLTLQAHLGSHASTPLSVTARSAQTYPLVRLPVVFHLAKYVNAIIFGKQLQSILDGVNALYRDQRANPDPNHADSFIEFYLAAKAPSGQPLTSAGLNPLNFDNPPTDALSGAKVDSILKQWCIKKYINVFVNINWDRNLNPPGSSFSSYPPYQFGPAGGYSQCETIPATRSAIMIADQFSLTSDIVAHELGHMLGLTHTFGTCQSASGQAWVPDVPRHEQAHPDDQGYKLSCNAVRFLATNVMDYYNEFRRFGFTHDQVSIMRQSIAHPTYLPL